MKGYVQEQLLEARRRTALHCRIRGTVDRDYLVPDAPPFDPEADDTPTGFVIVWAALALSIAAAALIIFLVLR